MVGLSVTIRCQGSNVWFKLCPFLVSGVKKQNKVPSLTGRTLTRVASPLLIIFKRKLQKQFCTYNVEDGLFRMTANSGGRSVQRSLVGR